MSTNSKLKVEHCPLLTSKHLTVLQTMFSDLTLHSLMNATIGHTSINFHVMYVAHDPGLNMSEIEASHKKLRSLSWTGQSKYFQNV